VISPSQGLYHTGQHKHRKTHKHMNIHASSGIRTYDHGIRASEDSSCLRPLFYRDRLGEVIHIIRKTELMMILKMAETSCYFRALLSKPRPLQLQDCFMQLKAFFNHHISCIVRSRTSQTEAIRCWYLATVTLSPVFRVALFAPRVATIASSSHCTNFRNPPFWLSPVPCCIAWVLQKL
jgi:hypothetical protein